MGPTKHGHCSHSHALEEDAPNVLDGSISIIYAPTGFEASRLTHFLWHMAGR